MRPRSLILLPLLSFALALPATARPPRPSRTVELPPILVRLASLGQPRSFTVEQSPGLRFLAMGQRVEPRTEGELISVSAVGDRIRVGGQLVSTLRIEGDLLSLRLGGNRLLYPEALVVTAVGDRLTLANECHLEAYTAGVLASECPSGFMPEAIRAMAVATRSYSFRRAYLSRAPLCDQVHCQVYRGLSGVRPSIQDAVRATEGQVALFDGQVIEAVYSSDCGGHTEANDDAWGGRPAPYLRPVPDGPEGSAGHYCAVSQRHEWNVRVSPARLRALVGGTEAVLAVELAERTATGKVRRVRVRYRTSDGEVREKSYTGVQWQKLVGAGQVLGLKYTLRLTDGGLEIEGRGWGHGVGLCQHGAQGMARQGRSTPQILRHYYSGIELGSLPALSELAISQMEQRRRDWVAAWGGAAPVLLRSPIGASPAGILAAPALEPVEKKRERVAEAPVTPVTPRMRPAPTARPRTAAVPDSSAAPTAGRAAAVRLSLSRTTAASANRAAGVQLSRVGALRRRFLRPDVARQAASDRVTLASSARRSTGRRSRAQAEGE